MYTWKVCQLAKFGSNLLSVSYSPMFTWYAIINPFCFLPYSLYHYSYFLYITSLLPLTITPHYTLISLLSITNQAWSPQNPMLILSFACSSSLPLHQFLVAALAENLQTNISPEKHQSWNHQVWNHRWQYRPLPFLQLCLFLTFQSLRCFLTFRFLQWLFLTFQFL
jgi:hypothetical protein